VQRAAYAEDRPRGAWLAGTATLAMIAGVVAVLQLAPRAEQAEALDAPQPRATVSAHEPTEIPADVEAAIEQDATTHDTTRADASVEPPEAPPAAAPTPAPNAELEPAPAAATDPTTQPASTPVDTTAPVPLPARGSDPTAEPALAPTPASAATPSAPPARQPGFVRGRIAYLRCDGLTARSGPFPCPRDRALERAVWQALSRLERCAPLTPGPLELRVEIGRTHAPSFDLRAEERDRARAAHVCMAGAFVGIRTTLSPDRMVISFTFALGERLP
jgi:hypothetical protein